MTDFHKKMSICCYDGKEIYAVIENVMQENHRIHVFKEEHKRNYFVEILKGKMRPRLEPYYVTLGSEAQIRANLNKGE